MSKHLKVLLKTQWIFVILVSLVVISYFTVHKLQDRAQYGLIKIQLISSVSYFNLGG